ncbi:Cof-type HAD-IIB family hydrolase [uncultured Alistipes sp.]|uniref:Cof-type HAD-IIB family hydrolase n=1 Tax=uncultured Alistipes sp. TaxID=538949 RepID=UPI00267041AB|nr:Cof-type HAD-IIB family hydrolase [uncultured Alistipes sp.]
MIRALFFDVDGTLVSFATHQVPDSTREALAEAHGRGVRIFIATGRASGDLGLIAGIPRDGVVALNGAECRLSDGECIACRPIPQADFERSMELAEELGFAVALEFDDGIFVDRVTPEVVRMAHSIAHPVPEAVDLRALFAQRTCCQMCFFCDEETQRRIMPQLPGLAANRWCPIFTDINACGTDKAQGVAAMAARFGLAADEIMAFGDGGNDIPMLRAAGVGVAMGEAGPEVQAAADYVTASVDDDGIRKALIRFGVIGSEN